MKLKLLNLMAGVLALVIVVSPVRAADKPNIVHIVADDLGWKDVGFNGAADIKTPNLDKLAAEGAKFTHFYVQPMCTPTRAALMTERYPFRYGLQTIVIPTAASYGLDTTEWLMPQWIPSRRGNPHPALRLSIISSRSVQRCVRAIGSLVWRTILPSNVELMAQTAMKASVPLLPTDEAFYTDDDDDSTPPKIGNTH